MSDIKKRLRVAHEVTGWNQLREAADAIERRDEEIERMRAQLRAEKYDYGRLHDEIERLRAELKEYEKLGTAENIAAFLTQLTTRTLR